MKLDVLDVIKIITDERRVLEAVVKAVDGMEDNEINKERIKDKYKSYIKECNNLIVKFNCMLIDEESKEK